MYLSLKFTRKEQTYYMGVEGELVLDLKDEQNFKNTKGNHITGQSRCEEHDLLGEWLVRVVGGGGR